MVRAGDEWPEHPLAAVYHDNEGWWGWQGHGWVVAGAPPPPFPFVEEPLDRAVYGPPGTVWIFTTADLLLGYAHLPTQPTLSAINAALKKLGHTIGSGPIEGWRTPDGSVYPEPPKGVTRMMRWIRTQIVAVAGQNEEVVHVHNWRHSTTENAPVDSLQLRVFGNEVRNAWANFIQDQGILLSPAVKYTEVRASVLEQANPGDKPTWPQPTAILPFGADVKGSATTGTLPYEVACGISLNTNWRGTSRFRGRTYLGPMGTNMLTQDGLFAQNLVDQLGGSFGVRFVAGVANQTDYELHVVSQKYGTSAKVQGIRMGVVPDSQRRRRRDLVEAYHQVWGDPVGAF